MTKLALLNVLIALLGFGLLTRLTSTLTSFTKVILAYPCGQASVALWFVLLSAAGLPRNNYFIHILCFAGLLIPGIKRLYADKRSVFLLCLAVFFASLFFNTQTNLILTSDSDQYDGLTLFIAHGSESIYSNKINPLLFSARLFAYPTTQVLPYLATRAFDFSVMPILAICFALSIAFRQTSSVRAGRHALLFQNVVKVLSFFGIFGCFYFSRLIPWHISNLYAVIYLYWGAQLLQSAIESKQLKAFFIAGIFLSIGPLARIEFIGYAFVIMALILTYSRGIGWLNFSCLFLTYVFAGLLPRLLTVALVDWETFYGGGKPVVLASLATCGLWVLNLLVSREPIRRGALIAACFSPLLLFIGLACINAQLALYIFTNIQIALMSGWVSTIALLGPVAMIVAIRTRFQSLEVALASSLFAAMCFTYLNIFPDDPTEHNRALMRNLLVVFPPLYLLFIRELSEAGIKWLQTSKPGS